MNLKNYKRQPGYTISVPVIPNQYIIGAKGPKLSLKDTCTKKISKLN